MCNTPKTACANSNKHVGHEGVGRSAGSCLQVSQSGHDAEDTQAEDTKSGAERSKAQRKRRDSDPQFVPSTKAVVLQSPSEYHCALRDTKPVVSCTGQPAAQALQADSSQHTANTAHSASAAGAGAIVVSFRGTEATNLLNWQTNITINMTTREGLGGMLVPGASSMLSQMTMVRGVTSACCTAGYTVMPTWSPADPRHILICRCA